MDVYARRRLVAVLAIVLVLVLIGVAVAGGGDDEQTPITTAETGTSTPGLGTPLSKDEFIEQGDAICAETAAGVANLTSDDSQTLAEDERELTESQLDQLRTLVPPEEDQKTLDQFFSAMEDQVDALDKRVLALDRADDTASLEAETELGAATDELRSAAKDYGFEECGRPGEPSTDTDTETDTEVPTDTSAVPTAPATTPTAPATTPTTPAAPPASSSSSSGGSGADSGGVSP